MSGDRIRYEKGRIIVPDRPSILFIEGDGIGPEIWSAARLALDAAVEKAYGKSKKIDWVEIYAGEKAFNKFHDWLPQETLDKIREYKVALKGPLKTPVGEGIRSINVRMRKALNLFASVRPIRYIRGVPSPVKRPEMVNMVVFRENLEDVYAGIEWKHGSKEAREVIRFVNERAGGVIDENAGIGIKPMSEANSKNLVRAAIRYAIENKRRIVTLMHKGNIMKYTEGAFREWGYELAREEFGGTVVTEGECRERYDGSQPGGVILINDRIADDMFQQVLLRPELYDVIATPNLNGDYLSDALAAQVGGVGMSPGANIGAECALFESIHGTAPRYAGQDRANPSALILSGEMMLRYLGWDDAAGILQRGLEETIGNKTVTQDLARMMDNAVSLTCSAFGRAVAAAIGRG